MQNSVVDMTYESESPRKRLYHRITGTIVMMFGSIAAIATVSFLLH